MPANKSFGEKYAELYARMAEQDWEPDQDYINPTNPKGNYRYLSSKKVDRNLSACLKDSGLYKSEKYSDLNQENGIGRMTSVHSVMCTITFHDTTSDASITHVGYGRAGDSGDKDVGKAQTYAKKYLIIHAFDVNTEDGDPDGENFNTTLAPTPQNQNAAKQLLSANQVKPLTPTTPPAQNGMPAPTEVPATTTDTDSVNTLWGQVPKEPALSSEIPKIMVDGIMAITKKAKAMMESGNMTADNFGSMMRDAEAIKTTAEAQAFVKKWRL